MFQGDRNGGIEHNVLRAGVSSGLVTAIFQPTMKIQRNENDQLSEMPELRLPAVMPRARLSSIHNLEKYLLI